MDYKDYYKIMGLADNATDKDIKQAYRRLARKYHPDLNKQPEAESQFKELGEAYEVLKDPKKKQEYDHYRQYSAAHQQDSSSHHQQQAWGAYQEGGFDADGDFFESLFGERFRQSAQPATNLHATLTITLEEAFQGVTKELSLSGMQNIRVKIPAGVQSGQQLRLAGKGHPGKHGTKAGDLYLTIMVAKHPIFDVVEQDIYLTLPITPWEAALGATIVVPTLGGKVDLKIPPGSQGGQRLRLKQRGLSGGCQYILLKIVIPQPQTQAAKALYEAMAKEMPFNPRKAMGV